MARGASHAAPGRPRRNAEWTWMQSQQRDTADLKVAGNILTRQTLHIHEVQDALGHSFCGSRQPLVIDVPVRQPSCHRCKGMKRPYKGKLRPFS